MNELRAPRDCPIVDVDIWGDDVLADPYPTYAELRESGPVVWLSRHDAYAVTRYAEVKAVLQDWRTYSSASGVGMTEEMNRKAGGVLTTDPPEHDPLRAVLNSQLVARRLDPHVDRLSREADDLVSHLVAQGTFDAAVDLAQRYSVTIVSDLVGFPDEGRDQLIARATAGFNTFGPDNELLRSSVSGLRELFDYCGATIEHDLLEPGGWGHGILEAGRTGDIAPGQCVGLLLAYAWAGMDTTVNGITAAMKLFADHPDQWRTLRDDRSLLTGAINEVLRIEPPVQRFSRAVTNDTRLGDVALPARSRVVVLFGAANRDPRRYERPDEFDITRNPSTHLSFGWGIHRCVGAVLAQLETRAVLTALLDRVDRIEVITQVPRRNNALHGLERLDVAVHRA